MAKTKDGYQKECLEYYKKRNLQNQTLVFRLLFYNNLGLLTLIFITKF
jgi:hypothetical protein